MTQHYRVLGSSQKSTLSTEHLSAVGTLAGRQASGGQVCCSVLQSLPAWQSGGFSPSLLPCLLPNSPWLLADLTGHCGGKGRAAQSCLAEKSILPVVLSHWALPTSPVGNSGLLCFSEPLYLSLLELPFGIIPSHPTSSFLLPHPILPLQSYPSLPGPTVSTAYVKALSVSSLLNESCSFGLLQ